MVKRKNSSRNKALTTPKHRKVPTPIYKEFSNPILKTMQQINQRAEEKGGKFFIIAGISVILIVVLLLLVFKGPLAGQAIQITQWQSCPLNTICFQMDSQLNDNSFIQADAAPGDNLTVKVIAQVLPYSVSSADFILQYDPVVLNVMDVTLLPQENSTNSPVNWAFNNTLINSGVIKFTAMADPANTPFAFDGLINLVQIEFNVIGAGPSSSLLSYPSFDVVIIDNTNTPVSDVTSQQNATINIVAPPPALVSSIISSCGQILSVPPSHGGYILNSNLVCNTSNGITITGDNVNLDCQNYKISGPGTLSSGSVGILIDSAQGVTIQNCSVTQFELGMNLIGTNQTIVQNNGIWETGSGMNLINSNQNNINNNLFYNNFYSEGGVIFSYLSEGNLIESNTIINNNQAGIIILNSSNSDFNLNNISNNGAGIYIGGPSTLIDIHGNYVCSNSIQDLICADGSTIYTNPAFPNTFQLTSSTTYPLGCGGWPVLNTDYNFCSPNNLPTISPEPVSQTIIVGQPYYQDINATDTDLDTLEYSLVFRNASNDVVPLVEPYIINSTTGIIDWPVTVNESIGVYNFTVIVDDLNGGTDVVSWIVSVILPPPTCIDIDIDGFGTPASALCTNPDLDCDNTDDNIYPGALEICGNGIDEDCSGADLSCITNETGLCDNGDDDDGDGFADCADSDCSLETYCESVETMCADGFDNDADGDKDCDDSDCATNPVCSSLETLADVIAISRSSPTTPFTIGTTYTITITVGPVSGGLIDHLILVQVNDSAGDVQSLFYQFQPALASATTETVSFSYTPATSGTHSVNAFVWSDYAYDGGVALLLDKVESYVTS
jgi:parallel beta-helix repeat protein